MAKQFSAWGRQIDENTDKEFSLKSRIVGLDPSPPGYENNQQIYGLVHQRADGSCFYLALSENRIDIHISIGSLPQCIRPNGLPKYQSWGDLFKDMREQNRIPKTYNHSCPNCHPFCLVSAPSNNFRIIGFSDENAL
jgi:hypothetical protein